MSVQIHVIEISIDVDQPLKVEPELWVGLQDLSDSSNFNLKLTTKDVKVRDDLTKVLQLG
jgi:hypothetical protein